MKNNEMKQSETRYSETKHSEMKQSEMKHNKAKHNEMKGKGYGARRAFFKLFPKMYQSSPALFFICGFFSIMQGIFLGVQTIAQQHFFDTASLFSSSPGLLSKVVAALLLLGLTYATSQILNGVVNFLPNILQDKISGRLSLQIHEKIARLAPVCFERTDTLDDINKAEEGKNNAFWFVLMVEMIFTAYLPYFLFMGWYLFTLKPILAAAILIAFFPTALAQLIRSRAFSQMETESAPVRREFEYYESCMVSREYFKETRLLGAFSYFKQKYMEALHTLQRLKFRASLKSNLFELSMQILAVLGYVVIIYLLFQALMGGDISVGAFAAIFNSIGFLYSLMEEMITRHISQMAQSLGTIENYLRFLDLEEQPEGKREAPVWGDITLDHVSFSYPGAPKKALSDVSFTLKKGETLAIVGENGSGKSTLVRLICGLYQPDQGHVYHNGQDIAQISPEFRYAKTSAVFQKYQRYQMNLRENLSIGDFSKPARDEELDSLCRLSGLTVSGRSFPEGYDTMLSREFDGVDLSGGQWQRIAISRGLFRDHDLILLDEPTAAIDPYEETRIYNQFARIAKEKSAVIVTHRLGSVKLADKILVMKDGTAVQLGTHEELIAVDGEYRRLYESQEQWYTDETPECVQAFGA